MMTFVVVVVVMAVHLWGPFLGQAMLSAAQ